jgi:REP element-mobilizing transposase RayT
MGYPLREEIAGAYYHVGTRGNNRRDIYTDDTTRLIFYLWLQILVKRYRWRIVAYCLMVNHYHLVLQIGDPGLSRGMQGLNGGYAKAFNAREGRRDHLFGRRFWSRQLDDVDDLIRTCVYVDLNPTRSFDVAPADWAWSGHRAAIGLDAPTGFHKVGDIWRKLDPKPRTAMDSYAELVAACL